MSAYRIVEVVLVMLKTLRQRREIFSDRNTILLTKPLLFQNTTLIDEAILSTPDSSGERRFYGFTFRPDESDIPDTFSKGFFPKYIQWVDGGMRDMSLPKDCAFQGSGTIESYVCHYAAIQCGLYSNIYLIDIRAFGGIVRAPNLRSSLRRGMVNPRYDGYQSGDGAFRQFPITKEVYRLETLNPVPGEKVVGVVTVASPLFSPGGRTPAERLKLHVNPDYEGKMDGARAVAERFNGGGWVVV
ncbi:hypothetical protein [Endozoicomonas lisbonensis]|uniref:Uncharacterized protein n=1 Tax=Endozoicomonas lisbonensis TaxID=3120522 RepID=A0ABV2SFB9_9GAMM